MLRALLRDHEAAMGVFEKVGLFKTPELLEKYVIASEVTVEVLDLFLSRVFGAERATFGNDSGDLSALWESLGCFSLRSRRSAAGEDLSARPDVPDKAVEGLCAKVQDLERQLCAMQRQLEMQGEVSQLAMSLDGKLGEIERECDRQVSDLRLKVSDVSEEVVSLKKELNDKASNGEVMELSEKVSHLKDAERRLEDGISSAEKKAADVEKALRDEIQRLDVAMKAGPIDPLNGIIAELTRQCGGNVHEKGLVEVTASSVSSNSYQAKNAVELGTDSFFQSNSEPTPWICYDFKRQRVTPTSYSIRTVACCCPRSWALEVSNDGEKWEAVDTRNNNEDLNAEYVTHNFAISAPPRGSFRFIRLRQTGKNHNGNDYLAITSLEVFGTLSPQ